ncbi:hypothetical protein ACJX0J_019029 [Zea mays]
MGLCLKNSFIICPNRQEFNLQHDKMAFGQLNKVCKMQKGKGHIHYKQEKLHFIREETKVPEGHKTDAKKGHHHVNCAKELEVVHIPNMWLVNLEENYIGPNGKLAMTPINQEVRHRGIITIDFFLKKLHLKIFEISQQYTLTHIN